MTGRLATEQASFSRIHRQEYDAACGRTQALTLCNLQFLIGSPRRGWSKIIVTEPLCCSHRPAGPTHRREVDPRHRPARLTATPRVSHTEHPSRANPRLVPHRETRTHSQS